MVRATALTVGLFLATLPRPAAGQELALAFEDSQSVGYPEEGRLLYPFALESGDRIASVRPSRFGTRELVGLLARAADAVTRVDPSARLAVGDLSSEAGGHLTPHQSHQSGRDADVGFYVLDASGAPVPQAIFIDIGVDGTGRRGDLGTFTYDDARNWALLVAFVDDPMAEVQHVLIASHLRARLLEYKRRIEAPEDQLRRVELVTSPIRGSERHDDHFHIRIYCAVGDRPECLDRPPLHPWYDGTPSPQAVAAARAADNQRAAALRRQREMEARAETELRQAEAHQAALEVGRAQVLAQEPSRQAAAERRRAAALDREQRLAIRELQRAETALRREQAELAATERGRATSLAADQRRWHETERARANRTRERYRAEQRRQEAATQAEHRRRLDAIRRAERQRAADERRAAALQRRSEDLARQRFPSPRSRREQ